MMTMTSVRLRPVTERSPRSTRLGTMSAPRALLCEYLPLIIQGALAVCLAEGQMTVRPSDILNVEYLPSTLLMEEAALEKEMAYIRDNATATTTEGDLRDAFLTMQYHRSKMNEYMCRVYVADEILSELGEDQTNRLGRPASNHRTSNRDHLLSDQGSSSYKDWLSRSTLLDDVYRHYDSIMSGSEEIESGEVTGYAVQQGGGKTTSSGHGFSASGGPAYGLPPSHSYSSHPVIHSGGEEHYYIHEDSSSQGKTLALKELYDLALTALAFLAFGVFVMNLILTCVIGTQGTTIVMQTTQTTGTSTGEGAKTRRKKRATAEEELNEMAYRVSRSVEAVLGQRRRCLRYVLCRDGRRSRQLSPRNRLWLPLWSFGLSWVSGHMGEDRLANLRGAVLGLGAANCEEAYPTCARA